MYLKQKEEICHSHTEGMETKTTFTLKKAK